MVRNYCEINKIYCSDARHAKKSAGYGVHRNASYPPIMKAIIYAIDSTKEGQRIDNFLFTTLKGVPKSLIYRLLRTGKIKINGKRIKQTYRLAAEDRVSVPELRTSQEHTPVISEDIKSRIQSSILYEDESILIVNKPAGIAVHPGHRIPFGVIEVLRASRPNASLLELAHRLDRHTSGCLLVAKNKNMLNDLHELLRDRKIQKEYLALVKGKWNHGEKKILVPLRRKNEKSESTAPGGTYGRYKTAISYFSPLQVSAEFSLMSIRISTGRTHQIRIHAAQAGYPVAGDQKYGDPSFNCECRKYGLMRMFLHASKVTFQCRSTGVKYAIKAPLSTELTDFLGNFNDKSLTYGKKIKNFELEAENGT